MDKNDLIKFNAFRKLCLANAETALASAESLIGRNANHIIFHLAVLSLEEIGKIFIGWYHTSKTQHWDRETINIPFDDHIKKLFYAIWMPSLGMQKISKTQVEENQGMATILHKKRLIVLYTDFNDTVPLSQKIPDAEAVAMISFVRARLKLAEIEGEVDINATTLSPMMAWFMEKSDEPARRTFIFGEKSQEKLAQLGDFNSWITWLKEEFEKEERQMITLAEQEIKRPANGGIDSVVDKWKLKIKISTPSHSIKPKDLKKFNDKHSFISLAKGGDSHTIFIEFTFGDNIAVGDLWGQGWLTAKLFVAALNIGSNGLFYWNVPVDAGKYYEKIIDLSTGHAVQLTVGPELRHDWSKLKMVLTTEHLFLADMVFNYFIQIKDPADTKAITEYTLGVGLLAKNDIHFLFNANILLHFYNALRISILMFEESATESDWHNIAYSQIEGMLAGRATYDHTVALAKAIADDKKKAVSLTDITAMKNYAGIYLLTIAARKQRGDNAIKLIANVKQDTQKDNEI